MRALAEDDGRLPRVLPGGSNDPGGVQATLAGIVRGLFRVPDLPLRPETAYTDIPGWDSLSQINVIFGVEQNFGVRFSDDELDELRMFEVLGELETLIRTKVAAQAEA